MKRKLKDYQLAASFQEQCELMEAYGVEKQYWDFTRRGEAAVQIQIKEHNEKLREPKLN